MSTLSASYNPNVYNGLNDLELVDCRLTDEQILGLGNIILEHGHNKEVTAIKAHRHFALADTEAMLEVPDENCADGSSIAQPAQLDQLLAAGAKPNVIALDSNAKQWFPVNYSLCEQRQLENNVWKDEEFLRKCAEYLVKNGLVDKLMLGLRRRCPPAGEKQKVVFLETNKDGTRTSEMRPMGETKRENTFETTFSFEWGLDGNGGKMCVEMECDDCCCAHTV